MLEDWAAVAEAITSRVRELGWQQRELARRSHVSPSIVREIQGHTVERRRSSRTLEALSIALGWHPRHLDAVLRGRTPPQVDESVPDEADTVWSRLDSIEQRLVALTERLDYIDRNVATVAKHVSAKRRGRS